MTYQGTMDAEVFKTYIISVLLPVLPKGSTLILDNASVHKSTELTNLFAEHGCTFLFLPPYSPELNPIEQCWAWVKQKLYQLMSQSKRPFRKLLDQAISFYSNANFGVSTS